MKNILIVDDEREMRELYENFLKLKSDPSELVFSNDGIDAYMKCATMKFDVIILDHKMPRLSGLDLLVALRNTEGPNQDTPVLFVSAHVPVAFDHREIMRDVVFLSKPITYNSLVSNLDYQLRH